MLGSDSPDGVLASAGPTAAEDQDGSEEPGSFTSISSNRCVLFIRTSMYSCQQKHIPMSPAAGRPERAQPRTGLRTVLLPSDVRPGRPGPRWRGTDAHAAPSSPELQGSSSWADATLQTPLFQSSSQTPDLESFSGGEGRTSGSGLNGSGLLRTRLTSVGGKSAQLRFLRLGGVISGTCFPTVHCDHRLRRAGLRTVIPNPPESGSGSFSRATAGSERA